MIFYIADDEVLRGRLSQGRVHSDNFPWLEILAPIDLYDAVEDQNFSFLLSLEPESRVRRLILEGNIDKALELEPGNYFLQEAYSEILVNEAKGQKGKKEYNSAQKLLEKAIELTPKSFVPYQLLGETYLEQEKPGLAIEVLTKSIDVYPYDSNSHMLLGVAYGMKKKWSDAESEFLKAVEIDSKNTLAWNNLAKAYWDQSKKEEAKEAWRQSLKINPNQPEVRKVLRQK